MPLLPSISSKNQSTTSTPRSTTSLTHSTLNRSSHNVVEQSTSYASSVTNAMSPAYLSVNTYNNPNSCTQVAQEQIVVGISASVEDGVEDWSNDFRLDTNTGAERSLGNVKHEPKLPDRSSATDGYTRQVDVHTFMNRLFPPVKYAATRTLHHYREHATLSPPTIHNADNEQNNKSTISSLDENNPDHLHDNSGTVFDKSGTIIDPTETKISERPESLEDEEEENWDAEIGLETCTDGYNRYAVGSDTRSDNFNMFIKVFHDMMDGEDIGDEDDESNSIRRKSPSSSDGKMALFQRRNDSQSESGMSQEQSSVHSGTRPSVEMTLSDRFRLVEIACSSAYAVRIERFPKPCTSYHHIEKEFQLPCYSDAKFERWLQRIVSVKCKLFNRILDNEQRRKSILNATKSTRCPFEKTFVVNVSRRLMLYRHRGDQTQSQSRILAYFKHVVKWKETCGYACVREALSPEEYDYIACLNMEIVQEAARVFASVKGSETLKWMEAFQFILRVCRASFPEYEAVLALIEIRYVCHHLVSFISFQVRYDWSICAEVMALPHFPSENIPISNSLQEILNHYGALFSFCTPIATERLALENNSNENGIEIGSLSGLALDPKCIKALILCDIQNLTDGKSVLTEEKFVGLLDLVDLEQDASDRNSASEHASLRENNDEWPTESELFALIPQDTESRRVALFALFENVPAAYTLIKAKCAVILSSLHAANLTIGSTRTAESLAYESLCLLEIASRHQLLHSTAQDEEHSTDFVITNFSNGGIVSELGRIVMEILGDLLISNQKYRFGIRCLEAACAIYAFLHHGNEYEKLTRHMCTLTLKAEDVKRALRLHEKVVKIAQVHGNVNEFVYLTQVLSGLWLREGQFAQAQKVIDTALQFLREYCGMLPPYFSENVNGSSPPASETTSSFLSARSSNTLSQTTATLSSRSLYSGELESWLNHDVSLHLMLRDVYRSCGRFMKAVAVVEHLLNYNMRLPRGKRTNLRMLLAEDALKCRSFDQSFWMLQALEQEALNFHERICEVGGVRSVGIGTEARFGYDMVTSCRYLLCRIKLHIRQSEFLAASAWLTIARFKCVDQGVQLNAKLDFLDASIYLHVCREAQERSLLSPDNMTPKTHGNALEIIQMFTGSMYALSTKQLSELNTRLEQMSVCLQDISHAIKQGIQAAWVALEQYQTLEDRVHQIKTLLLLVNLHTDPIRLAVFACGNQYENDVQCRYLRRTLGDCKCVSDVAKMNLLQAQKLLASALSLSEQVADVFLHVEALIKCAEIWMLLEKILCQNRKNRQLKEAGACWEEAVKLIKAVFFRRVSFCDVETIDASFRMTQKKSNFSVNNVCELASTFSIVPVVNFSETFLLRLDDWLMSLIWTACVFLKTDRLPVYLDSIIGIHFDELLSARMGLENILHQLRVYRTHQVAIWIGNANTHNCMSSSHRVSSSSIIQRSFIESPRLEEQSSPFGKVSMASPSTTSSSGSSSRTHTHRSSKAKRCSQHRKNLSMSSISELLASNVIAPSSFHDASYSYDNCKGVVSCKPLLMSPRIGVVSFAKRGQDTGIRDAYNSASALASTLMNFDKTSESSAHSNSTNRSRVRASLLGTPNNSINGDHAVDMLRSGSRNTRPSVLSRGSSVSSGFNDLDPAHSAKLRWVFNEWSAAKRNYIGGKFDVTALRYQNLRTLRFLLDAFDAQQVAILCRTRKIDGNEATGTGKVERAFELQGFDVAHLSSHALFQYKNHVFVIGYDAIRTSYDDSQFKFKVFGVREGATFEWKSQIPRPEWYLTHYDNSEADTAAIGHGILRTMRLLGIKRLLKILGSLLLEIPLVVIGSSFPQIKDVTLSLMKLLYPFQWPHVCVPFLPVSSWRFAYDSMHAYLLSNQRLHLRPRRSRHMRWGSSSNIMSLLHGGYNATPQYTDRGSQSTPTPTPTTPRPSLTEGDAKGTEPFVFGTLSETWDLCMSRFASNMDGESGCYNMSHGSFHCRVEERAFTGAFHIIDLDRVDHPMTGKHSYNNAIPLPRKWRKTVLEKLTRAVKYTRRLQQKTARIESRQSHGVSSLDILHFSRQSHHEHHTRSASHWVSSNIDSLGSKMAMHPWQFTPSTNIRVTKSIRGDRNTLKIDSDERQYYGFECSAVLRNGVVEIHAKLLQCCAEYQKKKCRQKSKRSAAKQEIKSWFSSAHDMEAFVERFCQTKMYLQFKESAREKGYVPSEWMCERQRMCVNDGQMAAQLSARNPRWGGNWTMRQLQVMAPMNSAQSVSSSRHSYRHSGVLSNPSTGRAPSATFMNLATISI